MNYYVRSYIWNTSNLTWSPHYHHYFIVTDRKFDGIVNTIIDGSKKETKLQWDKDTCIDQVSLIGRKIWRMRP